jgi:hypothetical protein
LRWAPWWPCAHRCDGPHFLGHTISHLVLDPRDGRTLLAAAKTGHLGPTIFRSTDLGRTWKEASSRRPSPAGRWQPGAQRRPHLLADARATCQRARHLVRRHLAAGPVPLEDGGVTWMPLPGVNDDPQYREWMGTVQDGTPDGPKLHSIIVDPRDPAHLYFGMSGGGVHESRDAAAAGDADPGWRWSRVSTPAPSASTTRIACGCAPQPRPAVPAEPLRHLPARPDPIRRHLAPAHRPQDAQATWATSASRWSCTRATPGGLGLPDGRHHRLATHQP